MPTMKVTIPATPQRTPLGNLAVHQVFCLEHPTEDAPSRLYMTEGGPGRWDYPEGVPVLDLSFSPAKTMCLSRSLMVTPVTITEATVKRVLP